jgi:endoglucanase
MKKFILTIVCIPLLSFAQLKVFQDYTSQQHTGATALAGTLNKLAADSIAADSSEMRTLNPAQLAKELFPGWNVGNSLEATGGETSWGNPLISSQLIDSIKAAGFNSVRIPVAWSSHFSNAAAFTIDPAFLARVEQVVNYVLNSGMYAMINVHWDGGWMQPTYAQQVYVNNRLAVMWKQIAIKFRDYDDHLLFAGMNEVMVTNNYSTPSVEYYTVHNSFAQTFVNAVRSTCGKNYYRYLAVQGFNTNIDYTYNFFAIPVDPLQQKRLLVEVHYYDPYNFTINTGSGSTTQWGNNAAIKTDTWANEAWADGQFQKMKTKFIDNGYGVILGEYGVVARLSLGTAGNATAANYRRYWTEYITRSLARHGLIPYYWDNGGTGNNGMGIFNRSDGSKAFPDIIRAVVDTSERSGSTGINELQTKQFPAEYSLTQNYPNPFNPTTVISYQLSAIIYVSFKIYDSLGREIADLVDGTKSAGAYTAVWDAAHEPSGVYFYRLKAGSFSETKKLVLLR